MIKRGSAAPAAGRRLRSASGLGAPGRRACLHGAAAADQLGSIGAQPVLQAAVFLGASRVQPRAAASPYGVALAMASPT